MRQLWDWKGSADDTATPRGTHILKACGRALARAHARSGDRIAIACLGKGSAFEDAVVGVGGELRRPEPIATTRRCVRQQLGRIVAQEGI